MAKETEKIRLPELPIFKKYSLAVRQEFATPHEILATLERTTARIQKLLEKAEDESRRKQQAERSQADRLALAEQEARWTDEAQKDDEAKDAQKTPVDAAPVDRETEKLVFEEQYLSKEQEQVEDDYDARPFWEVDDDELEEAAGAAAAPVAHSATPAPKNGDKPLPPPSKKPKPRKKARPRPQVVPVSGRGKPLKGAKKPPAKKASAKKTAKTKAKKKAGTKRKSKR